MTPGNGAYSKPSNQLGPIEPAERNDHRLQIHRNDSSAHLTRYPILTAPNSINIDPSPSALNSLQLLRQNLRPTPRCCTEIHDPIDAFEEVELLVQMQQLPERNSPENERHSLNSE